MKSNKQSHGQLMDKMNIIHCHGALLMLLIGTLKLHCTWTGWIKAGFSNSPAE
jgi:hypothetical protein